MVTAVFFFILGLLAAALCVGLIGMAKTALHEIEAGISALIAAMFFVGSGIVTKLEFIKRALEQFRPLDAP